MDVNGFAHSADDGPWCRDTRASSIAVRMQCGSIAAPQVRHRRTPGGSTPPAARIVHIHEHRFAVGGRPGGMTSPQYAHRCGCCECVAPVRAIVLAIHVRNGLNPPTGWQSRGLRTRQATRPCVHRDTGRPDRTFARHCGCVPTGRVREVRGRSRGPAVPVVTCRACRSACCRLLAGYRRGARGSPRRGGQARTRRGC